MSDLQNPIFDDEKEFLERQKLEYKNALLSDVTGLKDQTTQLGKSALLLGGALAGVWMVSKLVSSKSKKKKRKKAERKMLQERNAAALAGSYVQHLQTGSHAQDDVTFGSPLDFNQPVTDEIETSFYNKPAQNYSSGSSTLPANYALHNHYHAAQEPAYHETSFLQSDFVKALATQAMAFVLVYLSKKAEEYMAKNHDIATETGPETQDVDFSYLNTDAGKHL